jgi:2-amino-4-hydroxy-6-hydroxymethyldihydropteridine diphosphokinase
MIWRLFLDSKMIAFAGLGANLGHRRETLQRALAAITALRGTRLTARSSFYETEPVGVSGGQPFYLNAAVQIETALSARELLTEFLLIEKAEGRIRTVLNAPRTLDIDLLFFDQQVIEERDLVVPHPRLHLRKFNLIPLAEIAPQWVHPVLKKTVRDLLIENRSVETVSRVTDDLLEAPRKR